MRLENHRNGAGPSASARIGAGGHSRKPLSNRRSRKHRPERTFGNMQHSVHPAAAGVFGPSFTRRRRLQEDSDGLQLGCTGPAAMHGPDEERKALSRVGCLGRSRSTLSVSRWYQPDIRQDGQDAIRGLQLRGLYLPTSPREWPVLLATRAGVGLASDRGRETATGVGRVVAGDN